MTQLQNNEYTELNLPTESFDVVKLQNYFNNDNIKKKYTKTIKYIGKYYFESSRGTYIYYNYREDIKSGEKGTFEIRTSDEFRKEILNKVENNKLILAQIKMSSKIHTVVSELFKPRYYMIKNKYFLNECIGFKHKKYKPYDKYDKDVKDGVNLMLDFINEVSCCNNKEMFDSYLKYLATLCRGKKTDVIIYKKSVEGTGKSTESEFLMKYVFGMDVCLISGTEPLLTNYNKIFMGKIFVVFEELPTFSKSQWESVSSKLKTLTTEDMCVYRDLYEKQICASNLLNFQINTNVESLKDSHGRRIIILDINPSRLGDYKFFDNLKKKCFNDKIGEAFYSYLMTKITDNEVENFNAQRDFPKTNNKLLAISNQLNSVYKFIKMEYVLRKQELSKILCKELYNNYIDFCNENKIQYHYGRNVFYQTLDGIKINRMDVKNKPYYKVSLDILNEISNKGKWICEYDEYEKYNEDDVMNQLYPVGIETKENKDNNVETEKLQNRILELEEMINKKQKMEENKKIMNPDNENKKLKEENVKINDCFMDVMDENSKLRRLLRKHNIEYSVEDIKLNDILDNIEEDIKLNDILDNIEENVENNNEFDEMRKKTWAANKKSKEKLKNNNGDVLKKETFEKRKTNNELVLKGEKHKKKYNNSVEELFESNNTKEMFEIDF